VDFDEVRAVLRFGSDVGACAVGALCRAGLLGGIQWTDVSDSLAIQAVASREVRLDQDLERFAGLIGVWATARQPLGFLDTARVALVLDLEAYGLLGHAQGDARLLDTAGPDFAASDSEIFAGGAAELDAQIAFDLDGLEVALGGRISVETAPELDLSFDAAGLEIGTGVQTEAVVYIEGKIEF